MLLFLLIDDDMDDREFFQLALEDVDKEIICKTAKSGFEALTMLEDGKLRPDLIFLDLNMPLMDGWAFLKELKSNYLTHHLPVIIYSTSSPQHDPKKIKNLGAVDFITKPPKLNELSLALGNIVKLYTKKTKQTDI